MCTSYYTRAYGAINIILLTIYHRDSRRVYIMYTTQCLGVICRVPLRMYEILHHIYHASVYVILWWVWGGCGCVVGGYTSTRRWRVSLFFRTGDTP